MLKLDRPLVFFDLETTGLDPLQDRITQFGAVRLEPSGEGAHYETLVNPGRPLPEVVAKRTGLTDARLAGAPTFAEIYPQIWHMLHGADVAGHNIRAFDVPFLFAEGYRLGIAVAGPADRHYVDTWDLLNAVDPGLTYGHSLEKAYRHIFGAPYMGAHSALADAMAALEVFRAVVAEWDAVPGYFGGAVTPANVEAWVWEQNAETRAAFHRYLRAQRAQGAPASSVDQAKASV